MTRLIFWAGGVVALAAVAATAHGGYAVAVACLVPPGVAWLYPLITDGLALVAYGATSRTSNGGRRYAWSIVVAAAAMSGLAQAVFLGSGSDLGSSPGHLTVAPELAFGVGAWPALAVALVAHLLYLLHRAEQQSSATDDQPSVAKTSTPVTCDEAWAELEHLDEHGLNRSWETAPLAATDRPPAPDRPTGPVVQQAEEPIVAELVEDHRCGKPLPSKYQFMKDQRMGSGRADRLLNAAADRIGRPLKELQETK